jgi:hypothetical protein
VLRPRVILVEAHHDIDEVVSRIRESSAENIALIVPRAAVILQSIICLKILRSAAEKQGKQLMLVTHDIDGRRFAQRLGIVTAITVEQLEHHSFTTDTAKETSIATPNVTTYHFHEIASEKASSPPPLPKKFLPIRLHRPNVTLLVMLLLISLCLFFFIATLAFPGATIRISPQKKVITSTTNITLVTQTQENRTDSWRKHVLLATPIESVFEKTISFGTITKVFTGENASGEVVVVNTSNEEIALRPSTSLQTEEGIVMRLNDWVKIPPQGEAVTSVVVAPEDVRGNFVGEQGNLSPGKRLLIPRLPESYRATVWGEVRIPLTGGVSGEIPLVTDDDIALARQQIAETIVRDARRDLEFFVARKNKFENRDLLLLHGEDFLHTEILFVDIPDDIVGENIDHFLVHSSMKVRTLAFSQAEIFSILRGVLLQSVDPGMELISLDQSIFPEVVSFSEQGDWVKIAVAVRGVEAFVIESRSVSGIKFANKTKKMVVGKTVAQAKKSLENMEEVAHVEIDVWPPFVKKIPRLPENIAIKLME